MKAENFIGKVVTDQYGKQVTIIEVAGNIVRTGGGQYHADKVFYKGKSVYAHLNSNQP